MDADVHVHTSIACRSVGLIESADSLFTSTIRSPTCSKPEEQDYNRFSTTLILEKKNSISLISEKKIVLFNYRKKTFQYIPCR